MNPEWVDFPDNICQVAGMSPLQEKTPELPPLIEPQDSGHSGRCGRPAEWISKDHPRPICEGHHQAARRYFPDNGPYVPNPAYHFVIQEMVP